MKTMTTYGELKVGDTVRYHTVSGNWYSVQVREIEDAGNGWVSIDFIGAACLVERPADQEVEFWGPAERAAHKMDEVGDPHAQAVWMSTGAQMWAETAKHSTGFYREHAMSECRTDMEWCAVWALIWLLGYGE